jgi:hypothetical protein
VDAVAAGFELKSATAENLIEAVRTVAAGGTWIDGTLFTELGARDRAAAIVFAYDFGLVRPRP